MEHIKSVEVRRSDPEARAEKGLGVKLFIVPDSSQSWSSLYGPEQEPNLELANEVISVAVQALGLSHRNITSTWSKTCGCPCGCSPGFELREVSAENETVTPKGLECIDIRITI